MDPEGKMDSRSMVSSDKNYKRKSEESTEAEIEKQKKEMEVDVAALHEAGVAIQSLKRKVIRVKSGETQDYARETLAMSQEEAEEVGFVPSPLSEPRGPI